MDSCDAYKGPFIAIDATQLDVELSTRSQREQLSPINLFVYNNNNNNNNNNERSDPVDSVCRS